MESFSDAYYADYAEFGIIKKLYDKQIPRSKMWGI